MTSEQFGPRENPTKVDKPLHPGIVPVEEGGERHPDGDPFDTNIEEAVDRGDLDNILRQDYVPADWTKSDKGDAPQDPTTPLETAVAADEPEKKGKESFLKRRVTRVAIGLTAAAAITSAVFLAKGGSNNHESTPDKDKGSNSASANPSESASKTPEKPVEQITSQDMIDLASPAGPNMIAAAKLPISAEKYPNPEDALKRLLGCHNVAFEVGEVPGGGNVSVESVYLTPESKQEIVDIMTNCNGNLAQSALDVTTKIASLLANNRVISHTMNEGDLAFTETITNVQNLGTTPDGGTTFEYTQTYTTNIDAVGLDSKQVIDTKLTIAIKDGIWRPVASQETVVSLTD